MHSKFAITTVIALVAGCSSTGASDSARLNASANSVGSGGTAVALGTGGTPALNIGGARLGGAPGAGGTHSPTSGGAQNLASGGMSALASAGNSATGGALNSLPMGGSAGAVAVTGFVLDGFRIEIPCMDHFEPNDCHTLPADAMISRSLIFGGTPGITYEVTLRVRGLIEAKPITGGTGDSWFVVGGAPNDNAHETALQLSVASPAQHYFFNSHEVIGDVLYKLDYTAKIQVQGGSSLTFTANDVVPLGDQGDMASNWNNQVVEGIAPAPLPFDGQFLQFNVLAVEPPL